MKILINRSYFLVLVIGEYERENFIKEVLTMAGCAAARDRFRCPIDCGMLADSDAPDGNRKLSLVFLTLCLEENP